jgi:hypothetical protein
MRSHRVRDQAGAVLRSTKKAADLAFFDVVIEAYSPSLLASSSGSVPDKVGAS